MTPKPTGLVPSPGVAGTRSYSVPRPLCPVDLLLDGNEGAVPPPGLFLELQRAGTDVVRCYPSPRGLEAELAARLGIEPERLIVTAGADDAIDRICRAMLGGGRSIVLPEPTFEMIARYARVAGGQIVPVPWEGAWPVDAVLQAVGPDTGVVAIVSPNNPTGAVVTIRDVRRIAGAAPHALVLLDHAYVEFADLDLTTEALRLPNVVVTRTFSKAWGVAGLRVGYAVGSAEVVGWLRAAGAPYAVAGPSLAMASARVRTGEQDLRAFVSRVRGERVELEGLLAELGASPRPSQANFVFATFRDAAWVRDALAGVGIAVRIFPGREDLRGALRITCPGSEEGFGRLEGALRAAIAPDALLFDMDGVLVDVSGSYRQAIIDTAASFGMGVTTDDIAREKAKGDANNDWVVTRRLLAARGVGASLDEVKGRFEALYQGTSEAPGLRATERLLPDRALLERLAGRMKLGVVTGRPRSDAARALEEHGIAHLFSAVVCMEDARLKPDPAPVRRALALLDAESAWLIGDTPDDMRAARAARVIPIGIPAPAEDPDEAARVLALSGAGRVIRSLSEIEELLP